MKGKKSLIKLCGLLFAAFAATALVGTRKPSQVIASQFVECPYPEVTALTPERVKVGHEGWWQEKKQNKEVTEKEQITQITLNAGKSSSQVVLGHA